MRLSLAAILLCLLASRSSSDGETCDEVPIWRDGHRDGVICRADSAARGLTIIDLSEDWVPPILASGPHDAGPSYRATYQALAQERFTDAGPDAELAPRDRYFELFGIEPTFGVIRARLADPIRHRCHAAIDNRPLAAALAPIVEESRRAAFERVARAPTGDAFVSTVRATQAHLECDRVFRFPPLDGAYTWQTSSALATFQRGAMILPTGILDAATRDALVLDSRERDFRAALRVLRERVIAATGLIEDGTAGAGEGTVLSRALEPEGTWRVAGYTPLEDAAPDLVSAATEAAAIALGLRDAVSTRAFLADAPRAVAVALPPAPPYHSRTMTLTIEIDRGDVWHDVTPRARDVSRRPALIVYALAGARRIPLARWPTTIGGWQDHQLSDGDLVQRWEESPVGHRVWRDIYVGPTWLPPDATPDRELVRTDGDDAALASDVLGPSYRAAFGLVEFPHFVEKRARGQTVLVSEDVSTHGSGDLRSVADGASHGCHRLLGLHAVRLADFLLAHEAYVRRGDDATRYRRVVHSGSAAFPIAIDSLGYRLELLSPIPVNVLPGRVHTEGDGL